MMTRPCIITGITGQDGSYLAELLVSVGTPVVGLVRNREAGVAGLPPALVGKVELAEWDMRSDQALKDLLRRFRPADIYNFAAYSRGSQMFDDPVSMGEVNGLAVVRLLEAVRTTDPTIRLCQASSSEMYGDAPESLATEATPMRPVSPYGAAKCYAHNMVGAYRSRHDLFACSAILFNHESPRRGLAYVTRKITHAAARISKGLDHELRLGRLEACRDWGYAPDYIRAMAMMLRADKPDDYVIATGQAHSIRELCACAFGYVGLDYRDHVIEDSSLVRPGAEIARVGDAGKAARVLNWQPTVAFRELVELMVDHDLGLLATHSS